MKAGISTKDSFGVFNNYVYYYYKNESVHENIYKSNAPKVVIGSVAEDVCSLL